jgi:ribose-phosphate pyrophosphokinase
MLLIGNKQLTTSRTGPIIRFPSGETLIRLDQETLDELLSTYKVTMIYQSDQDIMDLLLLVDAMTRAGVPTTYVNLFVPYFPSSRADRTEVYGEAHGLYVYANLINNLGFYSIYTYDIHSSVAEACFTPGKFKSTSLSQAVMERVNEPRFRSLMDLLNLPDCLIVAPDKGAIKRASELATLFNKRVTFAEKVRDYSTGMITHSEVREFNNLDDGVSPIVVVDDICAGGGTFIGLAESLMSVYNVDKSRLTLLITHGLFNNDSMTISKLKQCYQNVFPVFNYLDPQTFIRENL